MSITKYRSRKPLYIVSSIAVLALIGGGGWWVFSIYRENQDLRTQLSQANEELGSLKQGIVSNPNETIAKLQNESTESILEQVRKLYALPEGETPTIATVQDIEKLKDQPFFDGAENGDILIVFESSSQAILFRPSEQRLVKVGPISVEDTKQTRKTQESSANRQDSDQE
jgi:cell division protein FtsB